MSVRFVYRRLSAEEEIIMPEIGSGFLFYHSDYFSDYFRFDSVYSEYDFTGAEGDSEISFFVRNDRDER